MKINTIQMAYKIARINQNKGQNKGCILLFLCATNVMGCQSTTLHLNQPALLNEHSQSIVASPDYQQFTSNKAQFYKLQFENIDNQGANAHIKLLNAINQHLKTDHVAVTQTFKHIKPFIKNDSVDALSDSVLQTLITTVIDTIVKKKELNADSQEEAYEDDENYSIDSNGDYFYGSAYRNSDDYLDSDSELYLNYIDEQKIDEQKDASSLESTKYVQKQLGLSDDYYAKTDEAMDYTVETYDCVLEYSEILDDLVADNPKINQDSQQLLEANNSYKQCVMTSKQDSVDIIESATGYQRFYIEKADSCKARFETQLSDLMSPSRQPKLINYEDYDTIFESYDVCYSTLYNLFELEPVVYIDEGWPMYILDYKKSLVECANTLIDNQDAAKSKGIDYKTDPEQVASMLYENYECEEIAELIKLENESLYTESENETSEDILSNDSDINNDSDSDSDSDEDDSEESSTFNEFIDTLLNLFKRTPAQIEAVNLYTYQSTTLNTITEFNTKTRQINSIYSYDYASPTTYASIQLPIGLDFNQSIISVDPSAINPIIALFDPEDAAIPKELASSTIDFNLPETVTSALPPSEIYDALINALAYSMSELDNSYFTEIDIQNDAYAKKIGARSAVKVNLGSQQSGKLLGVIVKHMANSLETYVNTHPDNYADKEGIRLGIKEWQNINKKYQTEDVGKLLQLIEAVGPFSFNKVNYYYFDAQNQLIAKQNQTVLGGSFLGAGTTTLSQTQFNNKVFNNHPLNKLFLETFGHPYKEDKPQGVDGNALLEKVKQRKNRLEQAEYARDEYLYDSNSDSYSDNDRYSDDFNDNDKEAYTESDIAIDAEYSSEDNDDINEDNVKNDAYHSSIKIVDYGNVNDYEMNSNQ